MKAFGGDQAKREPWLAFAYCLLIALGSLLICSKSSPLYPINDWTDANIYFSMGKGMAHGRMLYRDIYDHKGPLLYALHALCYLVSPLSFYGVWGMEILSGAFFLFGAWKLFSLYGAGKTAYFALPILAMLVFTSVSFQQGDSAEELCLPLLMYSLYAWLRYRREGFPRPIQPKTLMLHGALCGCVLWIKFTMLGFYMAWILLAFFCLAGCKRWKAAWLTLGWFVAGIILATLPWVLYFGLGGAMLPWLKTYVYDNLFLYSGGGSGVLAGVKAMVKSAWEWFGQNLLYTLPLALGQVWAMARAARGERLSLWLLFGGTALGVFIGGKSYPYYGLILAVFAGMGLMPLCLLLEKRCGLAAGRRKAALAAVLCALSFAGCLGLSPNVKTTFLTPREDTMQYRLAAVIAETPGATLLNFGFMDAGFYMATGITPNVKYFHQTNVPLREMRDEQKRYISEGICDYVVARGRQPEDMMAKYNLVAQAEAPEGSWYSEVYLYRLKTLKE